MVRVACNNGRHGRGAMGQNDVRRERGQFRRVPANVGGIARGPAGVDPHVAAVVQPDCCKPLPERPDAGLSFHDRPRLPGSSTPMRRVRSRCCARAATGHAAAPPSNVMNSRRFTASPVRTKG